MAGRRTFFSFHYKRDIWRSSIVRNAHVVTASSAAGWTDASLWEDAKRKGRGAIQRLIDKGLENTSVTAVLIGTKTSQREYVNYEIRQSLARGNGILGVHIHMIAGADGKTDARGAPPGLLVQNSVRCYDWDRERFGHWVELAAIRAGHACLAHKASHCLRCRLGNWFNG